MTLAAPVRHALCDRLQRVADVVAFVDERLEKLVDLLALDVVKRFDRAGTHLLVQDAEAGIEVVVRLTFDAIDLLAQAEDLPVLPPDVAEKRHGLFDGGGAAQHRADHEMHLLGKVPQLEQLDGLGEILDQVHHVVEIVAEPEDVFPVDGRIEGAVRGDEDLAGRGVRLRLDAADGGHRLLHRLGTLDEAAQRLRRRQDGFRLAAEELGEIRLGGHETAKEVERHGRSPVAENCLQWSRISAAVKAPSAVAFGMSLRASALLRRTWPKSGPPSEVSPGSAARAALVRRQAALGREPVDRVGEIAG